MKPLPPGVCLTFDDLHVANWCGARRIFDKYNVRATFMVSRLHKATEEQIKGLHDLNDDGHEIGFHTRTHPKLKPYLEKHGVERWVEQEIDRGIADHRAHGFPATSFAYPHYVSTPETRKETAKRFRIVRADGPGELTEETLPSRVYTQLEPDKVVHNIGYADTCLPRFRSWKWQARIFDTIAEQGGVGVFTGHDICQKGDREGAGHHSLRHQLRQLIALAAERNLRFYTLSEFATIIL